MKKKDRDKLKHVTPYHFKEEKTEEEIKQAEQEKTDEELLQAKKTKQNTFIIVAVILMFTMALVANNKLMNNTKNKADIQEAQVLDNGKLQEETQKEEKQTEIENKKPEYIQPFLEINESTIGYIKIENTMIDYPVVQTDNNDYYISHDINYDESKYGAIFMDFRCDIDDFSKTRNIILYGHRMKDGSMFKGLLNYKDRGFFLENRIIEFDTINERLKWEVFAVFETTTDFYYIDTEFPYDEMWLNFLDKCNQLSMHQTHIQFYKDDIVLTLSTCTTDEDGRFVVMARLKR